jgi:hypothetical protein
MMMNKMTVVVRRTVVLERLVEVPQAKSKKDAEVQAEAIAAGLNDQFSMVKVPGKWRADPASVVVFASEVVAETVVEEPKKVRNLDEEKALIMETIKAFPTRFRLQAFPDVLCRVGESMKHFFSEGEMQIVVEALQPDGKWLDFGRNTPEFLMANLTPEAEVLASVEAPNAKRVRKPKVTQ